MPLTEHTLGAGGEALSLLVLRPRDAADSERPAREPLTVTMCAEQAGWTGFASGKQQRPGLSAACLRLPSYQTIRCNHVSRLKRHPTDFTYSHSLPLPSPVPPFLFRDVLGRKHVALDQGTPQLRRPLCNGRSVYSKDWETQCTVIGKNRSELSERIAESTVNAQAAGGPLLSRERTQG